ncbi:MAG TPA: hypothetical protein VIV35_06165 [Chitinophagaceae bacterium]
MQVIKHNSDLKNKPLPPFISWDQLMMYFCLRLWITVVSGRRFSLQKMFGETAAFDEMEPTL